MTNLTNYPAKIVPDFETFNPVSCEHRLEFENLYLVSFEPEPDTDNEMDLNDDVDSLQEMLEE